MAFIFWFFTGTGIAAAEFNLNGIDPSLRAILSGEIDRLTGHVDAAEFESNRFLEDLELFISKLGREKADGSTDKIQEINTNLASLNWRSWGMRWMYL